MLLKETTWMDILDRSIINLMAIVIKRLLNISRKIFQLVHMAEMHEYLLYVKRKTEHNFIDSIDKMAVVYFFRRPKMTLFMPGLYVICSDFNGS